MNNYEIIFAIFLLLGISGFVNCGISVAIDISVKLQFMDREFRSLVLRNSKSNGKINLFEFAVESGVHGAIARWYLNRKAKQFSAFTERDELGEEFYYFGESKRHYLALLSEDS
ncbi:MAG: hypothetical protein KME17_20825 [Cyanosarcina radialis HA8281-LM2]|jgi:hypothetical protein|nr:hypothetical protein [Cyanosarcina radialis HA8281-LM2]